MIKFIYLPA